MISGFLAGCTEEFSHLHEDGTEHIHVDGNKEHNHLVVEEELDMTPRISGWPGKVNQHNVDGIWMTDPDGVSGWHSSTSYSSDYGDKIIEYCQKWWPKTVDVKLSANQETITFYTQGNTDSYVSTRDVYHCIMDSDGDGINDQVEGNEDIDNDGLPNSEDLDSDGDNMTDSEEGIKDTDGDGLSDYIDEDSDGDGISDASEGDADSDGDGDEDYLDADSDNDGISDETEGNNDTDGDGIPDNLDLDSDGDGHSDQNETNRDTDGDGSPDFVDLDSDGDGEHDQNETGDSDGDGEADRLESDVDDSDGDGLPDQLDTYFQDSDADGIIDKIDECNGTNGNSTPVNGFGCPIQPTETSPQCNVFHNEKGLAFESHGIPTRPARTGGNALLLALEKGEYIITLYCADFDGDQITASLTDNDLFHSSDSGSVVIITEELHITDDTELNFRWYWAALDGDSNLVEKYISINHMMDDCGYRHDEYGLTTDPASLPQVCMYLDPTPRISMWPGKVNQHNVNGTWLTDPDGSAGGGTYAQWGDDGWGDRKLEYCQRWWPDTTGVELRKWRENIVFYTAGNSDAYSTIKDVYECIEEVIDDTPRISYWPGKVNQHNENGTWMTDPDGVSGAGTNMLEYCKKWWPDTIDTQLLPERETITFYTRGNVDAYESTRDVYECVIEGQTAQASDYSSSLVTMSTIVAKASTTEVIILTSFVWIFFAVVLVAGKFEYRNHQANRMIDAVEFEEE